MGKTTILRAIAGLEKISNGEIWLNNILISSKNYFIEPEKRGIALSFQDNSLFPHLNVEDNLILGERRKSKIKERIKLKECIELFQLDKILKKFPHEISAGEAQRVFGKIASIKPIFITFR